MPVLVTYKFDQDPIKGDWEKMTDACLYNMLTYEPSAQVS